MSEPSLGQPSNRKRILLRLAALAFVGLVVCAVALYLGLAWRVQHEMKPTIIEYDQPMTLAEARRHSGLPFPESATSIRYACYSEFVAFVEVVRFEAPVDDCKAFAENVIAGYNAKNPDRWLPTLRPLPADQRTSPASEPAGPNGMLGSLKALWFTPSAIRSGLIAGESGSHQPMIWIDLEKGVLYYLMTD